jgi:hypothetical protein
MGTRISNNAVHPNDFHITYLTIFRPRFSVYDSVRGSGARSGLEIGCGTLRIPIFSRHSSEFLELCRRALSRYTKIPFKVRLRLCAQVSHQIRHNNIREECIIIYSLFGHIEQTVDFVN